MKETVVKNTYLAVDFGGGSGRVIAGFLVHGKLKMEEIYRFPNRQVRMGKHVYWDFPALFEEMKNGLKEAARRGYSVSGIGIDTWGVDFGLIDKNGNLLVLDITGELNRDKILLAKYFLSDIISNYSITTPKLLVLMPAMHFSFIDGINLEMFFDNLIYVPRIIKKELKLICTDVFLKQFISGHAEYAGIQLEPTLIGVINALIENANTKDLSDMITEKILSADPLPLPCSFDIRFSKDN